MNNTSDSLGYEADRTLPVEMSRPTESYASECRKQARLIQKTRCDPNMFVEVVSGLPLHTVEAVNDIGMGHLQDMKLSVMHQPMWTHVVNKVDLKNRSVKICGVDCNINAGQYTRLTGIRDRRREYCRVEDLSYTIFNLQYQLEEQRASLLLQCLKAHASEIHEEVRKRADDYHFGRTPSLIVVGVNEGDEVSVE